MRSLRLLVVASIAGTVFLAGCSGKPSSGGIQVLVNLSPGLKSTCVRVEVTAANGGTPLESGPIVLAGKSSPLTVGVAPTGQAEPVTVQAVGYADEGCNSRTVPAELSDTASGRFAEPVTVLTVTLGPPPVTDGGTDAGADAGTDAGMDAGVDQDGDGFPTPSDCDDTNPDIKPGAPELCVDRVDNNCNQATDCADAPCDGQLCATDGGAVCSGQACHETSCGDSADNDGDGMADCSDADCAGRACGVGGTCTGGTCVAPTEANLCRDGLDNDNDTFIDCLDPDCPAGSLCSDQNACTMTDVCVADGGCEPGLPPTCDMPPNALCYDLTGGCAPDSGVCVYKLNAGSTCNDGRVCTKGDTCDADGGCVGAPICDTPPSVCHAALGACDETDAGCTYAPLPPGGSCTDGNNCTRNDSCDGDGGCAGTLVTCTLPGECFARTGCDEDGGCLYAPATGQVCDGGMSGAGTCSDAGTCVATPTNVFPYTPSNFTEAQLPAMAAGLTFNCGTTTLNTGTTSGSISWATNCPGNPAAPAFTEVTIGTLRAVLLFADSLTVASGSTLRVEGGRALILAVRADAGVDGTIDVSSTIGSPPGAAANLDCTGGAGQPGLGGGTPETGGGGGGAAFGTNGANGANGFSSANGGSSGSAFGATTLVPLHGGCPGGNGGRRAGDPGLGGNGGGAVQLSVGGTLGIAATGRIVAAGAGGRGGTSAGGAGIGGGGGGSGGGILLEAQVLSIAASGSVTANGGGGGQGGGITSTGQDGQNGAFASGAVAGGGTGACGGTGGSGAAGTTNVTGAGGGGTETCSNNGGSGGGGGGGVGRIVLRASTSCTVNASAVVSPPARGNGASGCPAP